MSEKIMKAFCWRTGVIQLADTVPEGALELATAPATLLAQTVDAVSRHGYDSQIYLVPGVPEADDAEQALDAVFDFRNQLTKRLSRALAEGGDHVRTSAPGI